MVLSPPSVFTCTTIHPRTYHFNPYHLHRRIVDEPVSEHDLPRANTHFENWHGFIQAVEPFDTDMHRREEKLRANDEKQAGILVEEGGHSMPPFRVTPLKYTAAVGSK